MDPNKIAQNLAIKIKPYQLKIELVLISMIVIGVLLKNTEINYLLIVMPFSLLSILYFLLAFRLSAPVDKTLIFLHRLIYIAFSVGMLGILYGIQHYTGAAFMLRISIFAMFVGLIFTFISKLKNKELQNFIDADTIRIIIFTLVITGLISFGSFDMTSHPENINNQEMNTEAEQDNSNTN